MKNRPKSNAPFDPAYLYSLEKLIILKLEQSDLEIGLAYLHGQNYASISLDEYGKHNVNLHLYCSMTMEFLLGIEHENEEGEMNESIFALVGDDLLSIPDGLKKIMGIVISTGKGQVFRKNQLGNG
jgi:hypothetical protein